MTGRAAGYPAPGFMNPHGDPGTAWGREGGWGMGMAWRRGGDCFFGRRFGAYQPAPWAAWGHSGPWAAADSREQELEVLRERPDWLKEQMDAISVRIQELEQHPD